MPLRIANAAGFLGAPLDAARELVDKTELDYLTLQYLAGLNISVLARQREQDSTLGYARDFLDVLPGLCPALYLQTQLKIVTDAGGVHPLACAEAAAGILIENGSAELPVAVVRGDDVLDRLEELVGSGTALDNVDTGEPFATLTRPVVAAHAELGARPLAEALALGARLVIAGRVAESALTVGPAIHELQWDWDLWDPIAAATVAGHLIAGGGRGWGACSTRRECGVTEIGYPIAELNAHGQLRITKLPGAGGYVARQTVVEQLVDGIADPAHYLTPDVDADLTTLHVAQREPDDVVVWGATGRPAPAHYRVVLAYHAGFTAAAQLLVYGADCVEKAQATAKIILDRSENEGATLAEKCVELLGTGAGVPSPCQPPSNLREVVLRIAVADRRRGLVERFSRQIPPLVTSGPAGIAGYATGRPRVRPMLAHWPTVVPRELVEPHVEVRPAREWLPDG